MAFTTAWQKSIWREHIVYFFGEIKELVCLDSAVMNRSSRTTFLANMSGCKRFNNFKNEEKPGKIRWYSMRNLVVKHALICREMKSVDTPHVQKVLSCARTIDLYYLPQLDSNMLCSASLLELSLSECHIEDVSALSECASLTYLRIQNCSFVSDDSFVKGVAGCSQLRACYLYNCIKLGPGAVEAVLNNCKYLTTLDLKGFFSLERALSQITTVSELRSLICAETVFAIELTGSVFRAISAFMPHLDTLHFKYCSSSVTDDEVDVLVQKCSKITSFRLYHCDLVTNTALQSIAQHLTGLLKLYIDRCDSVTDAGILAVARAVPILRVLHLQGLIISNRAVREVGSCCRELTELNVAFCYNLTDDAFTTLNVARLNVLDVSGTRVIGTFALYVFRAISALHCFDCNDCTALGGAFVDSLTCYDRLRTFRIGSAPLNKAQWLQLSTKFPNVRHFVITNSEKVDDEVAQSFYTNCSKVLVASIRNCRVSGEFQTLSNFRIFSK